MNEKRFLKYHYYQSHEICFINSVINKKGLYDIDTIDMKEIKEMKRIYEIKNSKILKDISDAGFKWEIHYGLLDTEGD